MKKTQEEVLEIYNGLAGISKKYKGVRFHMAIERTLQSLKPEIKSLQKVLASITDIKKEYETERLALCNEFTNKTKQGQPLYKVGLDGKTPVYDIPTDKAEEFNARLKDLEEKHKEVIANFDTELKNYEETIKNTEVDVKLYTVSLSDIPGDLDGEASIAILHITKPETLPTD